MQRNFFPRTCCAVHKKHDKSFAVLKCCACAARRIAAMIVPATNSNLVAKESTKDFGDGPMSKNRRLPDEAVNLKSTNCGFKTFNHLVGTYKQTQKRLSYFYPKREVLKDGVYIKPLKLQT